MEEQTENDVQDLALKHHTYNIEEEPIHASSAFQTVSSSYSCGPAIPLAPFLIAGALGIGLGILLGD
jgi:hypothetical protein